VVLDDWICFLSKVTWGQKLLLFGQEQGEKLPQTQETSAQTPATNYYIYCKEHAHFDI